MSQSLVKRYMWVGAVLCGAIALGLLVSEAISCLQKSESSAASSISVEDHSTQLRAPAESNSPDQVENSIQATLDSLTRDLGEIISLDCRAATSADIFTSVFSESRAVPFDEVFSYRRDGTSIPSYFSAEAWEGLDHFSDRILGEFTRLHDSSRSAIVGTLGKLLANAATGEVHYYLGSGVTYSSIKETSSAAVTFARLGRLIAMSSSMEDYDGMLLQHAEITSRIAGGTGCFGLNAAVFLKRYTCESVFHARKLKHVTAEEAKEAVAAIHGSEVAILASIAAECLELIRSAKQLLEKHGRMPTLTSKEDLNWQLDRAERAIQAASTVFSTTFSSETEGLAHISSFLQLAKPDMTLDSQISKVLTDALSISALKVAIDVSNWSTEEVRSALNQGPLLYSETFLGATVLVSIEKSGARNCTIVSKLSSPCNDNLANWAHLSAGYQLSFE